MISQNEIKSSICLSDSEIVDGLIRQDPTVVKWALGYSNKIVINNQTVGFSLLFKKLISIAFDYKVEYNEIVNELYLYLLHNDAVVLKSFKGESSLGSWLKVVAIRFFSNLRSRNKVVDDTTSTSKTDDEYLYGSECTTNSTLAKMDVEKLLMQLKNEKYRLLVRRLILEDVAYEVVAKELNTSVDNVYNLKVRAIRCLSKIVMNEK